MKKLKILIVSQYFWPENFKINDFAFYFSESKYEVDVLTGYPNYPSGSIFDGYSLFSRKKNKEEKNNVIIHRSIIIPRGRSNKIQLFINYISFAFFASIKCFFLKKKYDLIFIYEPSPVTVAIPAIILKKIRKIPVIFWVTDLWPESIIATIKPGRFTEKIIKKIINPIVKWIYGESDKILVTSRGFIKSIEDKIGKVDKIEFFPQWAESIFKPIKNNKTEILNNLPQNSFKIMFAGNLGEAQDFESVIECARTLKNNKRIQWIIIGDGRKKNWIEEKVKSYNLEDCFHLLGSYPIEKMPEFYSAADAMLFSLKDEYIFSITIPAKVQSYLACGKPILGMVNGESSEIINKSQSGLSCDSGDYIGLSKNIISLSQMPIRELEELGNNSIKYYKENFDRKIIFQRAEKIFHEVLEKNHNG